MNFDKHIWGQQYVVIYRPDFNKHILNFANVFGAFPNG